MHAQVRSVEVSAPHFDAAVAVVAARLVPAVRQVPGFQGAYWFADQAARLIRAVEFFDSEPQLRASSADGERIGDEALDAVGGHLTSAEVYAVAAATGQQISRTAQFARALTWQDDPTHTEQEIRRIATDVMPGVRQNPGFQGGFWLVDPKTGRYQGYTLWDTAEHLHTSGAVGRQQRSSAIERGQMQVLDLHEYQIVARAERP